MKNLLHALLFIILMYSGIDLCAQTHYFTLEDLRDSVEIITDHWGIPHIYASNEEDLFFAQGFYAAKDRLFQFEIWRRQATGTVAEILGPRELKRDIGTRLFMFRGDMKREMNYYHPNGENIITSYVRGVNAYIDQALQDPDNLPLEFQLLDIVPKKWTPEIVISRHQGLLGNINRELAMARAVHLIGEEKVKELAWFHPRDPDLTIDPLIEREGLFKNILELYNAYRTPVNFLPEDIVSTARADSEYYKSLGEVVPDNGAFNEDEYLDIGSNNWVISGDLTESGYPIMANDPHRRLSVPSLRYMSHLVAPGWNVIGGGEPEIPGVSIGHNEYGAWGLTVYSTDAEDLYIYRLNPDNQREYWYQGRWEPMYVITDTIPVKDQDPAIVELLFTRHGPVTFVDEENQTAYAVRCGWLEIGGSPYLASLRMDQSRNFEEFREACHFSHIPGENMVWADRNGNIGWQAVGIAPVRRNWSGLVPVPGDGTFEWDGYIPIMAKPWIYNPSSGVINTSNENVTPLDYEFWDAIGFTWSDPYRGDRVMEELLNGKRHSLMDMALLQTDYYSIPARQLIPLLSHLKVSKGLASEAIEHLVKWDFIMSEGSVGAGIYNAWERQLRRDMAEMKVPARARSYVTIQMKRIIEWLMMPDGSFGNDPLAKRDSLLVQSFEAAVDFLSSRLGDDVELWNYGQTGYKHVMIRHPLSEAVAPDIRERLDVGPAPRGGNSYTVNNTSSSFNQASGGSFRMIVDTGNWDHTIGTNTPGQNGDPEHPQYDNLFDTWAQDKFFPVFFSREKVESVRSETWILAPD